LPIVTGLNTVTAAATPHAVPARTPIRPGPLIDVRKPTFGTCREEQERNRWSPAPRIDVHWN
jgi:hypothetical protein